jgi:hypothetical protein
MSQSRQQSSASHPVGKHKHEARNQQRQCDHKQKPALKRIISRVKGHSMRLSWGASDDSIIRHISFNASNITNAGSQYY